MRRDERFPECLVRFLAEQIDAGKRGRIEAAAPAGFRLNAA